MQPKLAPWRLFFPSALLLAPVNVLVWMALHDGLIAWPDIASATWHGREMLFGYTFAVIAGYLLPAMSASSLGLIWLLWLAGRLLWLAPPAFIHPWLALMIAVAFPALLAGLGAGRFLTVKRARNLAFPLILLALGVAALGSYATAAGLLPSPARGASVLSVFIVALLVMMMGGRTAPTATVGALRARGHEVAIRSHPGLEVATVLGMLLLVILDGSGQAHAAGLVAIAVAVVLALRMKDWKFGGVLHDPEVWPLHVGYLWLTLGIALIGLDRLGLMELPDAGALHALAAGGIGTVTLVMMVRVTRQRAGGLSASVAWLQAVQLSLTVAVFLRVCGGWMVPGHRELMLWLSATMWAAAFVLSGIVLLPAAFRPSRATGA
ncbi:MAG: NnrS family protein [Gammaproteobacteria bacterium]